MKGKAFVLVFILILFYGHSSQSFLYFYLWNDRVGYKLGTISYAQRRGWPIRSTECYLQLGGYGGSFFIYRRPMPDFNPRRNMSAVQLAQLEEEKAAWIRRNEMEISPFHFSGTRSELPTIRKFKGHLALTQYFQRRIRDPFLETSFEWMESFTLKPRNFQPMQMEVVKGSLNWLNRGSSAGRFVSISHYGSPIIKTWEVIFQAGDRGRDFTAMSIPDERLAKYAVLTMLSGQQVNIYFTQIGVPILDPLSRIFGEGSRLIRFQESELDVYKVEQLPIDSGSERVPAVPESAINDSRVSPEQIIHEYLLQ
ncbi:MAG: hypothetical protein C5B49_05355 [Bdellovibrio sp.]|nr:MAG: hypothetical protein C5B49_05355 [Bdellovibrio sp.]